jgi:serine phosphatase RsbU (regulator of sigma subunit)/anti-sigma regulatory factor (Ser/Thr protein kinase)
MIANFDALWSRVGEWWRARFSSNYVTVSEPLVSSASHSLALPLDFDIAPDDPLVKHLQRIAGPAQVDSLPPESPAVQTLKNAGIKMIVPLLSQGELVGLLNLGPHREDQEYSSDDFELLNNLATQAAPAVRVAQLVREQQTQARLRERMEQELKIGRFIQQTLLPKELPTVPGWRLAVHYQPAREVGGDLYDFFQLPDGRLVIVVGDVTDKGVPAALMMATTRAVLRGAARRQYSPGAALARSNNLLCPEMPPSMFVTCLYAILDPRTGRMQFANAGHNLPYRRHRDGVDELHATGMPLGLMTDMQYEENEIRLEPGDRVLFYSDGLVEAHNAHRDMFGFPRARSLVAAHNAKEQELIPFLMDQLRKFTGENWEQEDDITLLTLERRAFAEIDRSKLITLGEFNLPSETGNERAAMKRVAEIVGSLGLSSERLERLKTAVAETAMNAIEYGNRNRPDLPFEIRVAASDDILAVYVSDQGKGGVGGEPPVPDLDAKLKGLQSPRGWGLFLIRNMVDEMNTIQGDKHTVELILHIREN